MYVADRWVEAFLEKAGYVGVVGILFCMLFVLLLVALLGAVLTNRASDKNIECSENKKRSG